MLPTTHNSLKWHGNLTRYYQRCKTAATLTETERCLLHRQGPRLGPQVTADKTFRVWCTGSRSPRPAPASFHRVQETVRWGRCSDGDGHRLRLLPEGQLVLVHSHHRLLRLLHGNAREPQASAAQAHWLARAKPREPACPALPAWTGPGSDCGPATQCLGLSRWWWRSRRPVGTPLHTSVQPDPGLC